MTLFRLTHTAWSWLMAQGAFDTVQGTEKFLADVAPYRKIKSIRSDNDMAFTQKNYQALLSKTRIRHETSAPYSPHQNVTQFDIPRFMLIECELQKFWTYAVQAAALVRNRFYHSHTKPGLQAYSDADWVADVTD